MRTGKEYLSALADGRAVIIDGAPVKDGSEFGGRHQQYEMFYAGAAYVAKGYAYRNYGYDEALRSAEHFLASYEMPKS
jgi:aromatic ring hydroxylase